MAQNPPKVQQNFLEVHFEGILQTQNATYYGKTKRHFKVQICERLGISHLTGKKVKIDSNKLTAIQEHLLCCNYSPSFEDFSILTRESNDFKLKIMENLLIARDKPVLNKADSSLPLELF